MTQRTDLTADTITADELGSLFMAALASGCTDFAHVCQTAMNGVDGLPSTTAARAACADAINNLATDLAKFKNLYI